MSHVRDIDHPSPPPQTAIMLLRIDAIVSGIKKKGSGAQEAAAPVEEKDSH